MEPTFAVSELGKTAIKLLCPNHSEAILQYGLWDTIRVDHGKEFYLMLYVQEKLAEYRTNTARAPHLQSTSRQVIVHECVLNVNY